ncbi:serine/threonine-protein kinase [Chondromyces apiculatus]|uniref:Protein kinase domain-containing protein n=1 Tax=Chondromyces apiculatus DSM 436 TaxID=1192034 RepID=A0A017SX39_9BACT|nr:serine/threonine-protein kinase [Chondromyces apiculatus]EYF01342.1 Hypothetical protein CAP_8384 [Chondromyces apiculatus DSM 436]
MQVAPGVVVGGKYRLEKPLSRGGMGAVWMARHVHLASPVAVKFMYASYASSPALLGRFEREARIAASLHSPHVVHVQDYGVDSEVPYLVMELLQGEDLETRLQAVKRVPLSAAVQFLTQIGRALRRAHEAGLVHRDLKPCNIFLARFEDEEVVKVLDFGIVKVPGSHVAGEATRPGELLGSPHYMSPEQVRGDASIDYRSDLWSLAVILFRALTGVLPFPGEQLGNVMAKILVDGFPKATGLAPDLPPMIDVFFEKGLSRDREQRFQSVRAMLDDLRAIAGQGPVSTRGGGSGAWSLEDVPVSAPDSPRGLCFGGAGWEERPAVVVSLLDSGEREAPLSSARAPLSALAALSSAAAPASGEVLAAGMMNRGWRMRGLSSAVVGTLASVLLVSLGGGMALLEVRSAGKHGSDAGAEVMSAAQATVGGGGTTAHGAKAAADARGAAAGMRGVRDVDGAGDVRAVRIAGDVDGAEMHAGQGEAAGGDEVEHGDETARRDETARGDSATTAGEGTSGDGQVGAPLLAVDADAVGNGMKRRASDRSAMGAALGAGAVGHDRGRVGDAGARQERAGDAQGDVGDAKDGAGSGKDGAGGGKKPAGDAAGSGGGGGKRSSVSVGDRGAMNGGSLQGEGLGRARRGRSGGTPGVIEARLRMVRAVVLEPQPRAPVMTSEGGRAAPGAGSWLLPHVLRR